MCPYMEYCRDAMVSEGVLVGIAQWGCRDSTYEDDCDLGGHLDGFLHKL